MHRVTLFPLFAFVITLVSCSPEEQQATMLHEPAPIVPDYKGVTLPPNLAPIRFAIPDSARISSLQAIFSSATRRCLVSADGNGDIAISFDDWHSLIQSSDSVNVRLQGLRDGKWVEFDSFPLYISSDSVDSYIAYRKIEPGYEVWGQMGIYQRNLESFDETAILTNSQTNGGCMNCHSFSQRSPNRFLFHLRKECNGTYIIEDGKVEKLNTKMPETISALVYPSWHPSGRFVAFSTNDTQQAFHSNNRNRIEVFDNRSDVVVYDVERHEVFSSPLLQSEAAFETFPAFSPDGRMLYFCSADSVNVKAHYDSVHYSLCRIAFDPDTYSFASEVDTLYNARQYGKSVSFPRLSPCGRWLVYTLHGYGNFSIWHHDADLWLSDLVTGEKRPISEVNSSDTDSYHSWSSNGRWMVFSSRRDDGLYTRPYLFHIDSLGHCTKPLLVPQADSHYYDRQMKSYNIPEFVQGRVTISSGILESVAKSSPGIDLTYRVH